MKAIPLSIQTLYADLVQQVHAAAEKPGSVYKRSLKQTSYWYVKRRVGKTRPDIFLGRADDPAVTRKIAAIREENIRASERRKIVRALVRGGVPAPVALLSDVLDVLADAGLFRQAVLVGTAAYQCYSPMVGASLPRPSLATHDADLATATLSLSATASDETLETILKRADKTFRAVPGLDHRALPSSFRSASGFIVDLLTPQRRRTDSNPMPLKNLAAGAVPLQHLDWLIADPVPAVALGGIGIPVRVPAPARFAVHKLILSQKRQANPEKRSKDLRQAQYLIEALMVGDPWALGDAYRDAIKRGPKGWKEPIHRSLAELEIDPRALSRAN
ncbi:MAG: GSU2403 family nucleotidyltransferase fold protein [Parvibaculaceae bacterium]